MRNKKKIILFTSDNNAETAQSIRDYIAEDKSRLPIIIEESEFRSVGARLVTERLFSEDGMVMRLWESSKARGAARAMDKLPSQDISYKNNVLSYRKAYNIIMRYNPELIILNGAGVMREVLAARAKARPDIKVIMVIDSYVLNKQLINKHIDLYFVDNMAIKTTLVNEGIPEKRVILSDMPLPARFDSKFNKKEIYSEYNFSEEKPLALLAVPPADNAEIRAAIDILQTKQEKYNIIADCGKDREILVYARDRGIQAINEGRENAPLYALADIVISRPSSMIIAKTFAKNKLFFSLDAKGEEEKRVFAYLSSALVNASGKRLASALDRYLEANSTFDTVRQEIENYNAARPKGLLKETIDHYIELS
ncbi:MAG: hypothetical protein WC292_06420 [Clostridia bacterium]